MGSQFNGTQNINQFAMGPIQGMLDALQSPNTFSAQIDTTTAGGLVSGQAIKIVSSAGGIYKVVECALNSDVIFGFINYNFVNATYGSGDLCEISAYRGNVMYMTANAAISRNVQLGIVVASQKVCIATTGMTIHGYSIDQSAADGDLIRVMIDLDPTRATHA